MKRRPLFAVLPVVALAVVAGVVLITSASGGTGATKGEPWTGSPGVRVSMSTLQERQRKENRRTAGQPFVVREKPEPEGEEGEGGEFEPKRPGPAIPTPPQHAAGQVKGPNSSLNSDTSFLGAQLSESGFIPPDSMGSVSPTQVLVDVNGRIKVFDKQGNLGALNVTDSVFWGAVCNCAPNSITNSPTDPGVEYDRLSGRWIVTAVNTEATNNRVMVAISNGPTITNSSSFTFFFFNQNSPPPGGDNGLFADYPQMGVDKNAVYVGVNQFGSTFSDTTAFVIRKSSLIAGGPIVVTAFRGLAVGNGPGPFSPQPATNMDPNTNQGYIVGSDNQSFSQIDVRRITDPGGTPSMTGDLVVPVPSTSTPLAVPQGNSGTLDAIDDRLFEAMIARNPGGGLSLWTAHSINVNTSGVGVAGGTRDADRWYEIANLPSTPTLTQSGTLFDSAATNPRFFFMPSIAANGQGHASLNSSMAGPGRFAEVAATAHLATDPAGVTEPFDNVQSSTFSYKVGPGNPKRWGDYSQTVVDPTDNQTFWTFQEYANATNSWGVRVIKIKAPPPATPTAFTPNVIPGGQSSVLVQVTGTSSAGSGFFDPGPDTGGPGYPSHIDASVSGGVTVNSVTYTDPTHVTLDLNTTGAPDGAKDVTVTNPDGQSVTASNLLNIGSDTTKPDPPTLSGTTPASPSNDNQPKVFGIAEAGSTVQLYTDSGCTVPAEGVGNGTAATFASPGIGVTVDSGSTTTFHATATDGANNTSDCSTSSVTYVEDETPPAVSIDSGPSGVTNDHSPTFTFSGDPGATFLCSIDTGTAAFGACSGPGNSHTPASPLPDGSYSFRVRATDAAGNFATATRGFQVVTPTPPDTSPPDTTITAGPKKKTKKRRPKFQFTSTQPGSVFQCQLDRGPFQPCASPFEPPKKLKPGKHRFAVQAIDPAGNVDPAPAVRKFNVIKPQ